MGIRFQVDFFLIYGRYTLGIGIGIGWYYLKSYPTSRFFNTHIDTNTIYSNHTPYTNATLVRT
jgi:hypothetical protein